MAEVVKTYYDTGELLSEVYMVNGKKNGIYKKYHKNGQLWMICSYIDDKKNGEYKRYWWSGQLKQICSYTDDKKNGESKYYHNNGQLWEICSYIDDKKNGEFKSYYKNGQLWVICSYTNDKKNGIYKKYYDDGQLKEIGSHTNGKMNGEYKKYYRDGELQKSSTVANFATVQKEGGRIVERQIEHYNLDVIISVGYRVKSKQGTQFRIWANRVLKDHLLQGYSLNKRLNRLEDNMNQMRMKVDEIDFQIRGKQIPAQGVFFDGQVFDAYELTSRIIRSARQSVVLIDNYINETSLALLCKKQPGVKLILLSKEDGKEIIYLDPKNKFIT
jgi:antitoxin component YwqK of YwqJK toxin-antitoxin module